ncbi:hypothetical protein ER57_00775 [Smithella sp. SCADC]|jgi:hypothetical protein|nr:hypothetical protein ER57_00775 [Smithella sp. SCADC]
MLINLRQLGQRIDFLPEDIIGLVKKHFKEKLINKISPSCKEKYCLKLTVTLSVWYLHKGGWFCYQHVNYEHQLQIKKKQVQEAFWKIGKIVSPPVLEPIASPKVYHYRGKARYHAQNVLSSRQIGFLDISGGNLVDIEHCEIMEETINEKSVKYAQINAESAGVKNV